MKIISEIENFLNKKRVSSIEKKRLERDLEVVFQRLEKKEYEKGGFATNKFDVPDRTREFYIYLEFYCLLGKNWAALLQEIGINKYKKIVDLCPGYTPKVELALFYTNFKGEIILIDKDNSSMKELKKFMDLFNPQFKITSKKTNLYRPQKEKYDLIVANHVIDDLIIDHFSKKLAIQPSEIYEVEGKLVELWEHILSKKSRHIREITPKIVKIFDSLTKKDSIILISQYQSYMERLLDLNEVPKFNKKVLKKVIEELEKIGFKNDRAIVEKSLKNKKFHFKAKDCFFLKKLI